MVDWQLSKMRILGLFRENLWKTRSPKVTRPRRKATRVVLLWIARMKMYQSSSGELVSAS